MKGNQAKIREGGRAAGAGGLGGRDGGTTGGPGKIAMLSYLKANLFPTRIFLPGRLVLRFGKTENK